MAHTILVSEIVPLKKKIDRKTSLEQCISEDANIIRLNLLGMMNKTKNVFVGGMLSNDDFVNMDVIDTTVHEKDKTVLPSVIKDAVVQFSRT